jgi:periplasmic copper chaperone A
MVPWRAIEYMIFRAFVLLGALLIGGAAMGQTGQVEIKDAWARATPGRAENGAAYLTIQSPVGDRLVGVSSPVAKKAGLHTMTMEGSVMKMRPLGGVDLPANQPVTLKPGGMHIMLEGLNEPLQAGKSFPLTLGLEKAGQKQVEVTVEKAGAAGPGGQAGTDMPMPAKR